jgi:hypothetical protein
VHGGPLWLLLLLLLPLHLLRPLHLHLHLIISLHLHLHLLLALKLSRRRGLRHQSNAMMLSGRCITFLPSASMHTTWQVQGRLLRRNCLLLKEMLLLLLQLLWLTFLLLRLLLRLLLLLLGSGQPRWRRVCSRKLRHFI